jgi:hypothetical protein
MENIGMRATLTIGAAFLLVMLGWGFAIQEMGNSAYPPGSHVHCDFHSRNVTCTGQS